MGKPAIKDILLKLSAHENRAIRSFNLTPSENVLSPLAKLPLVADIYSRYFFEHLDLHGFWMFYGGIEAGEVQSSVLEPMLRRLTGARYVDTRPLSGLNCMTVVISGLCPPGGTMLTVPLESGGHMSTQQISKRLGVEAVPMPMHVHEVDLEGFERALRRRRIDVVYLDQSTQLFPIDPAPLRRIIDAVSPGTVLHCDTSHTNGLVLGSALPNPLERGAHTFGGSTHKTLPGPHKGFVATNDAQLAERIGGAAYDLISHHQVAASISLAITLDEFEHKDGSGYARRICTNALALARTLADEGLPVGGEGRGWTRCHQVWAAASPGVDPHAAAAELYAAGLMVNILPGLPSIPGIAFRFSTSELTRLGADEDDVAALGSVLAQALKGNSVSTLGRATIQGLRAKLSRPRYCYDLHEIETMDLPSPLEALARAIYR